MTTALEHNLELMLSNKRGGMSHLIVTESMGGNAGFLGRLPCIAANFYYSQESGEIVYFGNYQDVPISVRESFQEGLFRMAIDIKQLKLGIFEIHLKIPTVNDYARKTLEETAASYNSKYGFSPGKVIVLE